jgi:hypothetical protein
VVGMHDGRKMTFELVRIREGRPDKRGAQRASRERRHAWMARPRLQMAEGCRRDL